jgi:O-acetyl-ADP-ribose deacetylase (regulator of RNase III)
MNNIEIIKGNLFDYPGIVSGNNISELHIAHGVNCVGAMGAGIAVQFKKTFPEMYKKYNLKCKEGKIIPGCCWVWEESKGKAQYLAKTDQLGEKYTDFFVYNLAIKTHWKMPASYIAMKGSLKNLIEEMNKRGAKEIAMPWIGCGLGGMSKEMVYKLLKKSFQNEEIKVLIYEQ